MPRALFPWIVMILLLLLDWYIYYGLKFITKGLDARNAMLAKSVYWVFSAAVILSFWYLILGYTGRNTGIMPKLMISLIFISLVSKLGGFLFLFIDDLVRGTQYLMQLFSRGITEQDSVFNKIGRKDFLVNTGALFATSIGAAMTYGVTRGSHQYRVVRQNLALKNLPPGFVGLKVLQISDIHSGSFWNKWAVARGVDMIMSEEADLIFFTGDIVNNQAAEMDEYLELFGRINAPMGVYSILGNHDYGEYLPGFTQDQLPGNIEAIAKVHATLGWDLLRNEHRVIERNGEKINLIGVENWSNKMHFPRYGDLNKAIQGIEDGVQLLLSHDPSHWRGEVIQSFKNIQATFSGHTHGMQFGIETAGFKWSPVKYAYPEWAGMYREGDQQLYVNRGFGYLGFPGRLGIWPEITVFELQAV